MGDNGKSENERYRERVRRKPGKSDIDTRDEQAKIDASFMKSNEAVGKNKRARR